MWREGAIRRHFAARDMPVPPDSGVLGKRGEFSMRRHRLFAVLNLILAVCLCPAKAPAAQETLREERWYKGNLHTHTLWSDGEAFPEMVLDWYKDRGYNFVSPTDHNLFQNRKDQWRAIGPEIAKEIFDRYAERYGGDWAETRTDGGIRRARLKTFEEFSGKMNVPGEFLVIPGQEANREDIGGGRWVHCNLINILDARPYPRGKTVAETIRKNRDALAQYGAETGRETMFFVNHPHTPYFDVHPQDLIDLPEVRFYELLNDGPVHTPNPAFWSMEKFWDIVNAFRIEDGWLPLYGLAGDDRHNIRQSWRWIMVRAPSLTTENLLRAMRRGDFYASTGVVLEHLAFDPENGALSVKVKAEPGVGYAIRFNGTKKGFDRSTAVVGDPAAGKKPERAIPVYSDDIGKIFRQIEGTEAVYSLADDDLYVRVTVVSDREWKSGDWTPDFLPTRETAWSQPYFIPAEARQPDEAAAFLRRRKRAAAVPPASPGAVRLVPSLSTTANPPTEVKDPDSSTGYAVRQPGRDKEWSVQFPMKEYRDRIALDRDYLLRIRFRVRPEAGAPPGPMDLFTLGVYWGQRNAGDSFFRLRGQPRDGAYRTEAVARVRFVSWNADPYYFFLCPNSGAPLEGVYYDSLELIPVEEHGDALSPDLPFLRVGGD